MGIKFLAVTHAGCWGGSHEREASDLQKKESQRRSSVLGLPPRWKMAMLYDIGDLDVGCWSKFDTYQTSSTSSHIYFVLSDRYEWQCWMSLATVFNIFQRAHAHQKLLSVSMVMYCRRMRKSKVINHSLQSSATSTLEIHLRRESRRAKRQWNWQKREGNKELKKGFHETETATEKNLRDAESWVGKNSLNINWRRILRL